MANFTKSAEELFVSSTITLPLIVDFVFLITDCELNAASQLIDEASTFEGNILGLWLLGLKCCKSTPSIITFVGICKKNLVLAAIVVTEGSE